MESLSVTPVGNGVAGPVSPPALRSDSPLSTGVTLQKALHYRQNLGIPVIPWRLVEAKNGGKAAKVPWGLWAMPEALSAEELQHRWSRKPDLEVGVATGWKDDCDTCIIIVDCDSPEAESWARASLPPTPWMVRTRNGGLHMGYLYPQVPSNLKVKKVIKFFGKNDKRQLDILGDGGYAALPPSGSYSWENGEPDLEEMITFEPSWFPGGDALLVPRNKQMGPVASADALEWLRDEMGAPAEAKVFAEAQRYVDKALPAIEGQGGRPQTFKVACALVRDYALSFDQAFELLSDYNTRKCSPPWEDEKLFEHLEGAYIRGSSEFARAGNNLDNFVARMGTPTPEQAKEADDLSVAKQAALDIPGACYANPAAMFSPGVLGVAAILKLRAPAEFGVLKHELKRLGKGIDMRDWERAIKAQVGEMVKKYQAAPPEEGDRLRIVLGGADEKEIRDAIIGVLAKNDGVFVRSKKLAVLGEDGMLDELRLGGLRSVLLDMCRFVNTNIDDNGMRRDSPTTLPRHMLEMLLELQPQQAKQLRPVESVPSAPFFWRDEDGAIALQQTPGYHAPTKSLITECPVLDLSQFDTSEKALQYLKWLFADFPFQSDAEFHNYIGGLITPLVRPLIQGPVPILFVEANQPNSGKSHLIKIVQTLYCGRDSLEPSFPENKAEMRKTLFTMAFRAMPVTGFDNVNGVINSPELCAFVTAEDRIQGRILSTYTTANPEVKVMLVISANNGRCTQEVARRTVRVRLQSQHSVHQSRKYNVPHILPYIKTNRGPVLAALARLVKDWVDAGSPVPDKLPMLDTFETWAQTVGAICYHAGLTSWLSNKLEALRSLNVNIDEEPFVYAWYNKHGSNHVNAAQLVTICMQTNLMGHVLGDKSPHSQASHMGSWLATHLDSEIGDFRLRMTEDSHSHARKYYLAKVDRTPPE